jgi:SAM-dependent methyltransferase
VLQHVSDPDAAVAELTRVVRPGGRVCLVDTDWESLAVDGLPESMVAAVRAHVMAGRTPHHPSMGRTLRRRLVHAGLVGVTCEPVPLWFTDPTEAAIVTPIFNPQIPREAGLIPDDLRAAWFAAMGAAAACRDFLAVSTIWVAAGVKPA